MIDDTLNRIESIAKATQYVREKENQRRVKKYRFIFSAGLLAMAALTILLALSIERFVAN